MPLLYYLIVLVASFLVDIIPGFGPPAWSVMVFMQVKFNLNIWWVLVFGVIGSTVGRYVLARYIVPQLSEKFINKPKNDELKFLGDKLNAKGWRSSLFVLLYTLIPIPTTPLFTAAGIARIKPWSIIPSFFVGKFISDTMMVLAGKYATENIGDLMHHLFSWQSLLSVIIGLLLISSILFIDWQTMIIKKKLRLDFKIWKRN